jgi:hypothetical protein
MLAHSSSLLATFIRKMEEPRRIHSHYRLCPDDIQYNMDFFSTFEELKLPISGPMERAGVTKLYEPSPTPCLYVAPASCMVGRVPLIPLFLAGNSTPTIPHKFKNHKSSGFPAGICNTAAVDGQRGSNVYEVNQWLWQFGHVKLRLGGLSASVEETYDRKDAVQEEQIVRGAETCWRHKADQA